MKWLDINYMVVGGFLTIQSLWDMKHREILISISLIGTVGGIFGVIFAERNFGDLLFAIIPAGICFIFSKLSHGALGLGDAIVLAVMAFYCSLEQILSICIVAFSIAAIVALYLIIIAHKKGDYQIPFVPFLWIGWLIDMLLLIEDKLYG